eukprot:5260451-Pyramimonas_sp.AAC.1
MELQGFSLHQTVTVRKMWTPFPAQGPIGCARQPTEVQWSWGTGMPPETLNFEAAWSEWLTNMELNLCEQHDIVGPARD